MLEVRVSEQERAAGQLSRENFRSAAVLLHTAGYVVLREALPHDLVIRVREEFDEILRDCIRSRDGAAWYQVSRRHQAVFWERGARWRVFPKLRPPLNDLGLLANPLVIPLLGDLLGQDLRCKFVSSDTCVKGSEMQAPHREFGAGGVRDPVALFVNVPLGRNTRRNGPLEVWPIGTHLWSAEALERLGISDEVQDGSNPAVEELAARLPSERLLLEPGCVLIRNPGMLHRGTPNRTRNPRTMLTISYVRSGFEHDYGSVEYNLDAELFARLDPAVQRLFPDQADVHEARPVNRNRAAPSRQPLA